MASAEERLPSGTLDWNLPGADRKWLAVVSLANEA
jgi:hypothetical protein